MREDNNKELRLKDIAIREAIRQEVPVRPQMPKDLNARLMQRVEKEVNRKPKRSVVVWPWIVAACVIGVLMMVFTPPRSADDDALVAENKSEVKATEIKAGPTVEAPVAVNETKTEAKEDSKPKTVGKSNVETETEPKAEVRLESASLQDVAEQPVEITEEPDQMSEDTRFEIILASYEEKIQSMDEEKFNQDIIKLQKFGEHILRTWENN